MGRTGRFTVPDLPPGSHQELVDLLHSLHLRAGGNMSVRDIGERARLPHSTVHKALTGTELPSLHVAMAIGLVLANSVPTADRDRHLDRVHERIHQLWNDAAAEGRPPNRETLKAAVEKTWAEFSRVEGWARCVLNDRHELRLLAKCPILSINLRSGLVTVVVSTPDWETLGLVEDPQEWHQYFQTAVIQKLDYYLHVVVKLVPGFDLAANPCPPSEWWRAAKDARRLEAQQQSEE
ncbi:hypothetical protein OG851_42945 (plasmid) [Streptomyces sp. NBC_00161]|uniref:hypothetical protein n=1 Tax=Streptomyces sp. NBC_00161 TaxID=2975671 RepID=UPI002F911DEE